MQDKIINISEPKNFFGGPMGKRLQGGFAGEIVWICETIFLFRWLVNSIVTKIDIQNPIFGTCL